MSDLTIGLPVYNGADTLSRSIERLLSQTHSNLTLLISDNASTDATPDICQQFVQRDKRVQYYRHPSNLVWNENFRSLVERAQTPFFMWATHDDVWEPRFAEANLALLEKNANAVCSVSKITYERDGGIEAMAPDTGPLVGTPQDRLKQFLLTVDNCGRFYGVYRTQALRESFPADLHIFGTDWLVVALTLLRGDHVEVDEVLLRRGAQTAGHYHRAMERVQRVKPGMMDRLIPLRGFNRELARRLPPDVWRQIRGPLRYINLRLMAQVPEAYIPALSPALRPLRSLAANVLHRRWRSH